MFQMALLIVKENNCVKLFRNPCINVDVMARGAGGGDCKVASPISVPNHLYILKLGPGKFYFTPRYSYMSICYLRNTEARKQGRPLGAAFLEPALIFRFIKKIFFFMLGVEIMMRNGTRRIFKSKLSHFTFNVKLPFYLDISLNMNMSMVIYKILKSETA